MPESESPTGSGESPDIAGAGAESPQNEPNAQQDPSGTGTDAEAGSDGLGPNGERLDGLDYWKARARENEQRAKNARTELEQLKREAMTDSERAVAEARDTARAEALAEVSGRLVEAEVRTAAAGRPVNVDALLDGLDRSRFISESGEVDREALTGWLDQLAPVQQQGPALPDMGQGARGVTRSSPDDMFGRLITGGLGME